MTTDGARERNTGGLAQPSVQPMCSPVPPLRWRRLFPGHERELSALRRWLASLLPERPERDDLLTVANELASNAIQHTASGRGSLFAVEVIRYPSLVQVTVADRGGPAEPHVIEDPDGERGRGLLLVRELSVRTGVAGGRQGRLVWAQVAWASPDPAEPGPSADSCQAAIWARGPAAFTLLTNLVFQSVSGSVRGSPNRGSTLALKPVTAVIRSPAIVTTSSP